MEMSCNSNVENLPPHVIRQVVRELQELSRNPPEGIKVFINEEDLSDIQAAIEGPPCTPYANGLFRVKLALGKDFPAAPPRGYFVTKIFHPNVSKTGEICVNTLKKDWKVEYGIRHILLTVKCLLIVPNAESALNEEAGKLLLDHYDLFCQRAKMMTEIHAKNTTRDACCSASNDDNQSEVADNCSEPISKRHATDTSSKKQTTGTSKVLKEKKRTLKRL